jgi:RND family efflux transporter MFP subunit
MKNVKHTGFIGHGHRGRVCPALIVAIACLIWGCQAGSDSEKLKTKAPAVTGVQVMTVTPASVDDLVEMTGTVKSDHTSTIASRIMGRVTALYVREGDQVKAGQSIMKIEGQDLSQKLIGATMAMDSARQNRDLAETTWKRYRKLYNDKALSQQEMDEVESRKSVAESEYRRARAAVEEAEIFVNFTNISAPFSGTITNRAISEGGMAVPGQPLMTIESSSSLYVECFADESLMGHLKKGMDAHVVLESQSQPLKGIVRDIVQSIDPRSRTFLVKVGLPPDSSTKRLKNGLFVRVRLVVGKKDVLLVPTAALVQKGQLTGLFSVTPGGTVTYRLVKAGRSYPGERMEILSGLAANEQIIAGGVGAAVDGGIIQTVK